MKIIKFDLYRISFYLTQSISKWSSNNSISRSIDLINSISIDIELQFDIDINRDRLEPDPDRYRVKFAGYWFLAKPGGLLRVGINSIGGRGKLLLYLRAIKEQSKSI